jgi:hypothetical protein
VEVGAVLVFAFLSGARIDLVDFRVEGTLLPTVRHFAFLPILAALHVIFECVLSIPAWAYVSAILVQFGLSPIVLHVVCVHAEVSLVIFFAVWAPNCLEVENVKIIIFVELVDEIDGDFFFIVGVGTELAIFTVLSIVGVADTELGLVLIRMVNFLNVVVRFPAVLLFEAFLFRSHISADCARVISQLASTIFCIVVVRTPFLVVVSPAFVLAWLRFEEIQIQVLVGL